MNIEQFEAEIKYAFKNKKYLKQSLMHSSYVNENRQDSIQSNERLEFLGDAVLNLAVSTHICEKFTQLSEGELTRIRAGVVCEATLVKCAKNIRLGEFLLLGKCEELTGGRERPSILSDAFEAVTGAIYLDSSLEKAKEFVLYQISRYIHNTFGGDYKTLLQEKVQKEGECKIAYKIISESGPDHNKTFVAQVELADKISGTGAGKSKKEAEQSAAREALKSLGESDE